ncbi:hypothetical protein [Thetidibacter halocola]|uniref:Uncharacterized protein n=1 Tax=Thetidibacter halocola TaxID=2827239 RepID=A0A8J7W804_9RHOB|nr:hypothetical protein [Thetidibacter halocola]MBS0122665.1 hypothetical protein [Thetidibacter halocola]
MGSLTGIVILCALILVVAGLRAVQAVRDDRERGTRGSEPGKGFHVIDASYHSGGSGGGHSTQYRVPRDPQDYARLFIPKDKS